MQDTVGGCAVVPVMLAHGPVSVEVAAPYTPDGAVLSGELLLSALATLCLDEEFRHLVSRIVAR